MPITPVMNLTPHAINVYAPDPNNAPVLIHTYPPSGYVARVMFEDSTKIGMLAGAPVYSVSKAIDVEIPGLDKFAPGTAYLVSRMVLDALASDDESYGWMKREGITILAPDTGPDSVVRDTEGKILGVTAFVGL